MMLDEFLNLAEEYDKLGWAVQEQLRSVVDGEDPEDQNENALAMIEVFLGTCERFDIQGTTGPFARISNYLKDVATS